MAESRSPRLLADARRRSRAPRTAQRLRVDVWTVDDPAEIQALAAAGVDAIITNVPDVALAALA